MKPIEMSGPSSCLFKNLTDEDNEFLRECRNCGWLTSVIGPVGYFNSWAVPGVELVAQSRVSIVSSLLEE